ncbi:MAG: fold metallo-hydrolase [Micrococcaceae bacterium]|jgi:glyoxylase-like metal-dependent hydrolase (beta-lactamase superfamily II)|uniref:MBL fold metallo-hydrolase n=1 Tax=Arthrobacter cheniae TaxID=1258888 RepID=A0A3A5MFE5_9MICC|nr:MBL fold metallo-hydrolase [Arthrobacter cheniae]MCU1634540.1 fold metallo-hydrolase [Micrococcaceae bacterium]RJT81032.1 MBL fold metallo-hydrolase [Arthrobacter cheniae]
MIRTDIAPGIHYLEHARTNVYLIEDDDGVLLVDTGLPRSTGLLLEGLSRIHRSIGDVRAIMLTHGHFDHVGTARYLRSRYGIPVYCHPDDAYIAAHPYSYERERSPFLYPLRYPRAIPGLLRMTAAGAIAVKGVEDTLPLTPEAAAALPGAPLLVPTPGHTKGHCGLHFPDRDAVVSGDALVTRDPYTGRPGPQVVARAATADTATALRSLDALRSTSARTVLPGHGFPWRAGVESAVAQALDVGGH